jgi:hypothetical protein
MGLRDQEGVEETGPCVGAGTSGEWNKRTRLPCTGREGMRPGAKDTGAHLKSCSDKADEGGYRAPIEHVVGINMTPRQFMSDRNTIAQSLVRYKRS